MEAQIIENYLKDLQTNGYSPNTIRAYKYALLPLKKYNLNTITALDLMIIMGRNKDSNTAASRLAAIKTFFKWLSQNNIIAHDPTISLGAVRTRKHEHIEIPQNDLEIIFSEIEKTPLPARAFFTLLWDTDIQIYQALSLNIEDVDWQKRTILDKPISKSASLLRELCRSQKQGPLFLSNRNERAAYDWAYRWWKKIMKRTGLNYTINNFKTACPK